MALKDHAALYGRIALVAFVFAFVAGIVAAPLLSKSGTQRPLTTAQENASNPQIIKVKSSSPAGKQS